MEDPAVVLESDMEAQLLEAEIIDRVVLSIPFILCFPESLWAVGAAILIIGKVVTTLFGLGDHGLLGGAGINIMVGLLDSITMFQKDCVAMPTIKMWPKFGKDKKAIIAQTTPLIPHLVIVKTIPMLSQLTTKAIV